MNRDENSKILLLHKGKIILKFFISIILNVFLLIVPIYYSKMIDEISVSNFSLAYKYIIIFGILTIIYRFIEYFNQKAYYYLYLALYKSYMNLGLQKTFNNSIYSLSRFSLSEFSNIMSEDFEMVSDYYSTLIMRIVEILEFIYIIIYFFFINKIIGLLTLISSLIVIFILFYFNRFISITNTERKLRNDKRISLFQELFMSIKTIKGFNILKPINKRINRIIDDYIIWHKKLNMNRFNLREITLGIVDLFKIISLIIGIKLIINGEMTLGTITIIYSYYGKLSELFTSIITLSESLNNKDVSMKRINKLFEYASNHVVDERNLNDIEGRINFKNIVYGSKMKPILNDVNFSIDNNSLNLLIGGTKECEGIFDLLLRYNREHSGEIIIDDDNINLYSKDNISNIMGFIMEYPSFFNISIKDNLEIFDSNFENIINVCKYLNIHDDIMKLENGYETILINNAGNIDEDLKYQLAFVRIYLKKSKIILINNILEHVSKTVYSKLLKLIIELKNEHTIIMITKDNGIINNGNVDRVISILHGNVLGIGKHKDLISNNDYQKLINSM